MRYTQLFIKTNKTAKDLESINATLLQKAGFIDQTMAGVYTFLPLGLRVLNTIENIIREEINTVGTEMLLPALSPRELWDRTQRLEKIDVLFEARGANTLSVKQNEAAFILNPTHEEIITEIAARLKPSYRDLPFAVYQIQTKFRNEMRPKSGLLRGREFRMKDLYSFHATEADFRLYYESIKEVYMTIFNRLGLGDDTVIALASGGAFTEDYSHEFQTKCLTGEDVIYYDEASDTYYNKEVASEELKQTAASFTASEVGNIFPLGTTFSQAFDYLYTSESGERRPVIMASYGIGSSRIMGVLVEKFHDQSGIIWPEQVAPFRAHLVGVNQDDASVAQRTLAVYTKLAEKGVDVLFDDRADVSAGEKLADVDLIGIPWRLVVSRKTGDAIEVKRRDAGSTTIQSLDSCVKELAL